MTRSSEQSSATLYIASDHAGFELKKYLLNSPSLTAATKSWEWQDLGPQNADRVDYPDYAKKLCEQLLKAPAGSFGILICGSGQGMAMTANRNKGIRAALAWNEESASLSRAHNNANILCLGARLLEPSVAVKITEIFLRTQVEGGRHIDRVEKIDRL